MSKCEYCGQEMYGAIQCFKCNHRIDVEKIRRERETAQAEEARQERQKFLYRIWFRLKFGSQRSRLEVSRAALYDTEHIGTAKLAFGNVQFRDMRLKTTQVESAKAWAAICEMPELLCLGLTCGSCGFVHLLREIPYPGQVIAHRGGIQIGDFRDAYMGIWQSSWFQLIRPVIASGMGLRDTLVCKKCGAEGTPKARRY